MDHKDKMILELLERLKKYEDKEEKPFLFHTEIVDTFRTCPRCGSKVSGACWNCSQVYTTIKKV